MKSTIRFGAVFLTVTMAGCSGPDALQEQYGDAVRELMAAQVADPDAAARNSGKVPEGTDPVRAVSAVEASRAGVTKATETWNTNVELGSSTTVTD